MAGVCLSEVCAVKEKRVELEKGRITDEFRMKMEEITGG